MKWISQKEMIAVFVFLFLIIAFPLSVASGVLTNLNAMGVNLLEIMFARHITFRLVGVVMTTMAGIGLKTGHIGGKMLFGVLLVVVVRLLFS